MTSSFHFLLTCLYGSIISNGLYYLFPRISRARSTHRPVNPLNHILRSIIRQAAFTLRSPNYSLSSTWSSLPKLLSNRLLKRRVYYISNWPCSLLREVCHAHREHSFSVADPYQG